MSFMFLSVPLALFCLIVAPLWLVLHYRTKRRNANGLSQQEAAKLERLTLQAHKLQQRVDVLERILDASSPDWRQYDQG
ncbi:MULTISPECIES: envelope stress response membrane protein PspB [unclassified Vibrio]|uniref:Envelope stress response membrane protein PspB n=1 Tax=Vibrio sp. HB236076 TaxID=3232307 RepID=A0AB39H9Q8_9VIBR|nr:envelope stress response membrane protein PspB [Vibrio sp. HB161653]MDP5253618.1 envelope stress response membrane protein PspB [Vibrio sp. HB161653]